MKQYLFAIALLILSRQAVSQTESFESLMRQGKDEFKKDFQDQDFSKAAEAFEKAVKLQSDNPEAYYFLGYAYDRLNSKDAQGLPNNKLELALKASRQFEKVIQLSPKYQGEIVVLDPHSKITAIWGAVAYSYLYKNQIDSAKWAFSEGRKRGGFSNFYLKLNQLALKSCELNAILISYGDNNSFPLSYLQIMENYRTDVTVIESGLMHSYWYPSWLQAHNKIDFGIPISMLDTMEYCTWKDSTITIPIYNSPHSFSWTVKPTYEKQYLLRGDRLLLSLLEANKFARNVYFTKAFGEEARLNLAYSLQNLVFIDKLNITNEAALDHIAFSKRLESLYNLAALINNNNRDEVAFVETIRFIILDRIIQELNAGNRTTAKVLLNDLIKIIGEREYPYSSKELKKYIENLNNNF